jgi:hypothetical protein
MQLHGKDDIKIFILYLMHNLSFPMEYVDINDVVVQDGVVGTIDCAECFAELLDNGSIIEKTDDGVPYYTISEKGTRIVEGLQGDLLSGIKTRGLKNALRLLTLKDRGCRIQTDYMPRADGMFDLTCAIKGEGKFALEVKIVAENQTQLDRMQAVFKERPEIVYRGVLAILTGKIDYLIN